MDIKLRSSLDDSGSSALRRLIQPPRLGRRRSGTWSSSASSIISHDNHDHDEAASCVARDTSHDECALNRFIVWAAIKRNACPKMTAQERRECPLLRCRLRFPTHELMLQHLHTCDELASGEYWCYDCSRVERFNDAKCKRCLGHPSRRRKIMFMAKSFFGSLGHRSRNGSLPDLDIDIDEATPGYNDSLDEFPDASESVHPSRAELQANEVHEIDSFEVLPTITEEDPAMNQITSTGTQQLPLQPVLRQPSSHQWRHVLRPAELECAHRPIIPQPETVAPANLDAFPAVGDDILGPNRPSLHLEVSDVSGYRPQAKGSRSKSLAPSSSVRSTTSTASTNSVSSTASYAVSTVSSFSGGWGRMSGFDSALTTPADEFDPTNPFRSPSKPDDVFSTTTGLPSQDSYHPMDQPTAHPLTHDPSSHPPAEAPLMGLDPPSEPIDASSLQWFQPTFPFYPSAVTELPVDPEATVTEGTTAEPQADNLNLSLAGARRTSGHPLINTAWDTLEMHVSASTERLRNVQNNDLVGKLRDMSPEVVAVAGLQTLDRIQSREAVTSAIDLLCFVHLVYSLSLVIHEQDAPNRGTNLFTQAVSYASWLSREDRRAYLPVVDALWKPSSMSEDDAAGLIRKTSAASRQRGKEPQYLAPDPCTDPLIAVAQFFLDECEISAVRETSHLTIQASELCIQHMKDATFDPARSPQVAVAINLIQDLLVRQLGADPSCISRLDALRTGANSGCSSTTRRLELELMHVGKMSLPPDVFFDSYVPRVRAELDPLYCLASPNGSSRLTYHSLGVSLVRNIILGSSSWPDSIPPAPATVDPVPNGNVCEHMDTGSGLDDFDISDLLWVDQVSCGNLADGSPEVSSGTPNTAGSKQGSSTAATSPPSQGATPSTCTKVESSSCCEECGYRPEGDPRWFAGSMAKHKKNKHARSPPTVYHCPYPGCTSKFTSRPDNLRQHQIRKRHFVDGQDECGRRPSKKRKKV